MLTGGTGDGNLELNVKDEDNVEDMLSRVRSLLVFSVENKGTKIDPRAGEKKETVMMERWKAIFQKYDWDNSGTLRLSDIKRMVRRDLKISERLVSDSQITALFVDIDRDGGGTIDFAEFLEWVQKPSGRGSASQSEIVTGVARGVRLALRRNKIRVRDLEEHFKAYDDNAGDVATGELTPTDMIRFFRKVLKLSKGEVTDKALRTAFFAMDDDNSGKMSLEELMEFVRFCSLEPTQRVLPQRVPGLIGGMRGQLPERLPTRRPGTFRGSSFSRVPFCLNGRDTEATGRLARSTRCVLQKSLSEPGISSLDMQKISQSVSKQLSYDASMSSTMLSSTSLRDTRSRGSFLQDSASDAGLDDERPGTAPGSAGGPLRKRRVWSGELPGHSAAGYMLLKGASSLNQVEGRLFEAGIDVRGQYHKLGRSPNRPMTR